MSSIAPSLELTLATSKLTKICSFAIRVMVHGYTEMMISGIAIASFVGTGKRKLSYAVRNRRLR